MRACSLWCSLRPHHDDTYIPYLDIDFTPQVRPVHSICHTPQASQAVDAVELSSKVQESLYNFISPSFELNVSQYQPRSNPSNLPSSQGSCAQVFGQLLCRHSKDANPFRIRKCWFFGRSTKIKASIWILPLRLIENETA